MKKLLFHLARVTTLGALSVCLFVGCSGGGGFDGSPDVGKTEDPAPPPVPDPGTDCVTAKLSWDAPKTLLNGQPIPEGFLTGYKLYHGLAPGLYSDEILISGGGVVNYEVLKLEINVDHYFALRAVGSDGSVSGLSNEATMRKTKCEVVQVSFSQSTNEIALSNP